MAIDATRLGAGADAHEARLQGQAWADAANAAGADAFDRALVALVAPDVAADPAGVAPTRLPPSPAPDLDAALRPVLARLDALSADVAGLRAAARRGDEAEPLDAVLAAVGDPRAYDRPDARRAQVGVRFLPELERAVLLVGERNGMRTRVGAWEYVVRLGLGATALTH